MSPIVDGDGGRRNPHILSNNMSRRAMPNVLATSQPHSVPIFSYTYLVGVETMSAGVI
jgi:hypothetical protein